MKIAKFAFAAAFSLPISLALFTGSARACSCAAGTYVRYWPREELPANGRIVLTWMGEHPVLGTPPADRTAIEKRLRDLGKALRLRTEGRHVAKGGDVVLLEPLHLHVGRDAAQLYLRPKTTSDAGRAPLVKGKVYRLDGFEDSPAWKVVASSTATPTWKSGPSYDAEACQELYQRNAWSSCSRPLIPLRYAFGATSEAPDDPGFVMLVRYRTSFGAISWLEPHSYDTKVGDLGAQGCSRSPLRPPGTPTEVAFTPIGASGQVGPTRSIVIGGDAQVVEQWSEKKDACRPLTRSEVAQATRCARDKETGWPSANGQ